MPRDLLQHGARPGRVDQRQVGAGQLDQRLERDDGQGVGEQRTQPRGTAGVLARLAMSPRWAAARAAEAKTSALVQ